MAKIERSRVRKLTWDLRKFKSNQVKIGGSGIAKNEVEAENLQVALLLSLYVPGKQLQRLNEASKKQLLEHLPRLVDQPMLNFEIHLFLASIATNFVSSWYSKLGTENHEFVAEVYRSLCLLVEDFVQRLARAVAQERFLFLVDDFAELLKRHLEETEQVNGEFRFLAESRNPDVNRIMKPASDGELVDAYLASKHAIFDPQTAIEPSQEPRNLYFRVLTHKLLEATFFGREENPLDSAIVDQFVVGLVGDFILQKAFTKLSSPSFIIGTVLAKIGEISAVEPKPQVKQSLVNRVKGLYSTVATVAQAAVARKKEILATEETTKWLVFASPVFGLFNSICSFQKRIPVAFHGVCIALAILLSLGVISEKISAFCSSHLLQNVAQSLFLEDQSMADNLKNLRMMLFDEQKETDQSHPLTTETSELLFSNVKTILANSGVPLRVFFYIGETEESIRQNFSTSLSRFESQEVCNDTADSSKINQLLIIQILDLLAAKFYPELLDPVV